MGRDRDDKMGLRGHDDHDRDHGTARDHDKDVRRLNVGVPRDEATQIKKPGTIRASLLIG